MNDTIQIGVLLSGSGRTLQNILDRIAEGVLSARVVTVISSRGGVKGLERAADAGIDHHVVERTRYDSDAFSERISAILDDAGVDLVCMAGFLSLYHIPARYEHRVMNIHPALLPSFGGKGMYGHHVHQAVLNAGCKVSGCTVHFASNEYDRGPIIVQRTCPVLEDDTADTLADRVFDEECIAYPHAIELFAAGRLRVEGSICTVKP